ncbi:hypothetical protein L9F63_000924, partial [Diploptera punctata]
SSCQMGCTLITILKFNYCILADKIKCDQKLRVHINSSYQELRKSSNTLFVLPVFMNLFKLHFVHLCKLHIYATFHLNILKMLGVIRKTGSL